MTKPQIVRYGQPEGPGNKLSLPPERLVRNDPERREWPHYDSSDGRASAGTWSGEEGAWRIAFPEGQYEYFHVLSGRGAIVDADGRRVEFGAGDAVVIPAGFHGVFEVAEKMVKHFFFYQQNPAA